MMHKGKNIMTKLPLAPLFIATRCITAGELGLRVGLKRDVVQALKKNGVPIHRADQLATACGLHPTEVWGDDFYQGRAEHSAGTSLLSID